jgi:hypothetical protein
MFQSMGATIRYRTMSEYTFCKQRTDSGQIIQQLADSDQIGSDLAQTGSPRVTDVHIADMCVIEVG